MFLFAVYSLNLRWNQVLSFVQPISFSFSFRCAGALANRTRPVSLRSALPIQDMKIYSANIGTDVFISWIGVADRICRMTFRFPLHRLFKKIIISANTIGAVISDRYNLTPLRLIVMPMPIQKVHVQIANNPRSPQCHTEPELLCSSRPPSFFVTIYH
jgi:hypothetical protein